MAEPQEQVESTDVMPKRRIGWLPAALISSGAFLLVQVLRSPLLAALTVFLEPIVELLIFVVFLAITLSCLISAIRHRREPWRTVWSPFAACAVTAIIVYFTPFNDLYLKADFRFHEHRRTAIAQEIVAGKSRTLIRGGNRGDLVVLLPSDKFLSDGGEVMVDRDGAKTFVLFFTFRGILDRFSGFVYSPTNDPPAKTQFLGDGIQVERLAPHWFWYAS